MEKVFGRWPAAHPANEGLADEDAAIEAAMMDDPVVVPEAAARPGDEVVAVEVAGEEAVEVADEEVAVEEAAGRPDNEDMAVEATAPSTPLAGAASSIPLAGAASTPSGSPVAEQGPVTPVGSAARRPLIMVKAEEVESGDNGPLADAATTPIAKGAPPECGVDSLCTPCTPKCAASASQEAFSTATKRPRQAIVRRRMVQHVMGINFDMFASDHPGGLQAFDCLGWYHFLDAWWDDEPELRNPCKSCKKRWGETAELRHTFALETSMERSINEVKDEVEAVVKAEVKQQVEQEVIMG